MIVFVALAALLLMPTVSLAALFIDPTAPTCPTYDPPSRTCTGGTDQNYATLQAATAASAPGDVFNARLATHVQTMTGTDQVFWNINVSGTSGNPITYRAYQGEAVQIRCTDTNTEPGFLYCFDDRDDGGGQAIGPQFSGGILVDIPADYIILEGFEIYGASEDGVRITGQNNILRTNHVRSNWFSNINIPGGDFNLIENNLLRVSRHFPPMVLNGGPARTNDNTIRRNYIHHGGYLDNETTRVLPIFGDPVGGSNVKCLSLRKSCEESPSPPPGDNWCQRNIIEENVMWRCTDGITAMSSKNTLYLKNIILEGGSPAGTIGIKEQQGAATDNIRDNQIVQNVVYYDLGNGVETRGDLVSLVRNTIVANRAKGVSSSNPTGAFRMVGTLSAYHVGRDFQGNCVTVGTIPVADECYESLVEDGQYPAAATTFIQGDPLLPNPTLWQSGGALVIPVPGGLTVEQTIQWFEAEIATAFTPPAGSIVENALDSQYSQYTNPQTAQTVIIPCNGGCEIGAFEVGGAPPPASVTSTLSNGQWNNASMR